jgi:L-serine kinase (ADP)
LQVSSKNLNFKIALLEMNLLKPHEEVIENLVRKLSDEMEAEGEVRDPLIVDEKDHVILDGMHRFAALKKLRCHYAPCCLIDYDNPEVKVEPWFRVFNIEESEKFAERLLQEFDVKCTKERNEVTGLEIILVSDGIRFTPTQPTDDVQRARRAVELERSVSERGYTVEYQSSTVAIERWRSTDANFVIPLPRFSKQRIRKLVEEEILLPHKATCHIIPSRPLRLDVPLPLLRNETTTSEIANSQLTQLLSSRKINRRPPGSVIDGRRYEEELLIFAS